MKLDKNTTEFYERLKVQLETQFVWPSEYMFKFIIPSVNEKIAEIQSVFDHTGAHILTKDSAKGNYTSISVKVTLASASAVIEKYIEVSKVEGVISL